MGLERRIWLRKVPDELAVSLIKNLPPGSHQISACDRDTTLLRNAAREDKRSPPPPPMSGIEGIIGTRFVVPLAAAVPDGVVPAAAASPAGAPVAAAASATAALVTRSVNRPIFMSRGGGLPLTSGPGFDTLAAAMEGTMPGGTCMTPISRWTGSKLKDRWDSSTGTRRMRWVRLRLGSMGGRSIVCGADEAGGGDETERETASPAAFIGLGASTVGDATLPLTAPATALVTLAARERPRINEPKKLERGEVGLARLRVLSGWRLDPRLGGDEGRGSAPDPRPPAKMLAAGMAMAGDKVSGWVSGGSGVAAAEMFVGIVIVASVMGVGEEVCQHGAGDERGEERCGEDETERRGDRRKG